MAGKILWAAEHLALVIGRQIIFDDASLAIGENERVAMVGRNGSGKSTLLRIMAGEESPSGGEISVMRDLRVAAMPQDYLPEQGNATVETVVREGVRHWEELLQKYDSLRHDSPEREALEHQLTCHDAWDLRTRIAVISEKLALPDPCRPTKLLSGGEMRRVLLARAVVSAPDLLLLDEPTNHIDIDTVKWIEDFLADYRGACFLVTHDRFFLDRIATRIVELDHGKIYAAGSDYAEFLTTKAAREYAEDQSEAKRNSFLRREIEWVRRSPKARLRRNQGRINRFYEIQGQSAPRRTDDVELILPPPSRLGNKVLDLKNVSFSRGERPIIHDFSFEFTAKTKVGILGKNGAGKTTLLQLMTGKLLPDSGSVERAETVEFNFLDQNRVALNPEATVEEEVAGESKWVHIGADRISVWTYLKRFLFEDERIKTQVKYLSGGEKARLVLAKLLKEGGNFLILDEPTNDLDLSTLRVLEEALIAYPSALAVVSHDRYFLNRVCNQIIAFDRPDGRLTAFLGDYDNYLSKRQLPAEQEKKREPLPPFPAKKTKTKLSYKEERELAALENEEIPLWEEKVAAAERAFSDPELFSRHPADVPRCQAELDACRKTLNEKYARWEALSLEKERLSGD